MDIAGSSLLLLMTAPLQALCAAAIVIDDGLPVYYEHERVGKGGKTFTLRKLRSMKVGTDKHEGGYPTQASVTRVGRFIRSTSLDEIPQLFNILRGDMSLVGPRPALVEQVRRYTDDQRQRLLVRPGLTGLAQIRHRNEAPWSRRIQTDLEYISKLSFLSDTRILLSTIPAVLSSRGQVVGQTAEDVDDLAPRNIDA